MPNTETGSASTNYDETSVERLHQRITKALKFGGMLAHFPRMLEEAIDNRVWEKRFCRALGRPFLSIVEYMEHHEPDGCQVSQDQVESLIRDNFTVLKKWRAAGVRAPHRPKAGSADNISSLVPKHGTSRAYTLSRLSREAPGLHAAVCAGELSANAAAIQAGIRKPPRVTLRKAKETVAALTEAEKRELLAWLAKEVS